MSDFLKSSPTPSSAGADARKQEVMAQVKQELALANAQELMNKMNEKCFGKCITKPSSSLSSSEETCLTRCMDRYMEAFDLISRTYTSRVSRQRADGDVLN
ncbi:Tim10/DDP family zinc finger-domain-containing protein [Gautieria morchelliformis]|nr:Tim10/DDP family zinc finger-domain-containing protein [Gautieria morchelliformis]